MTKYKVVNKLSNKGFPVHTKYYKTAHEEASKAEKAKFPKGYEKLKKMDYDTKKGELIGKNLKSGKILVSSKVPKSLRSEVAFHEKTEHQNIKRLEHLNKLKRHNKR